MVVPGEKRQLENVINEVLKSGDVQQLKVFLQRDVQEDASMKCSQQFVNKLDRLVSRSLEQNDPIAASLAFTSLNKYGNNLKLCGTGQGLPGLITRGLIDKWFMKCKQLWIQFDQHQDVAFTVFEEFLNALMMIHESCKEGTYKVTESFLYLLGQLAVDPRVYILIQKEAIHKFNLLLDKMPVELKKDKKLLMSQESSDLMMKLAGYILDGGDYDFQSSLIESLFRMTIPVQRRELADGWFSMGHVASAFTKICDSEFETGCRQFLNMVNGMQGDRRRVYSYPCLEVYLDKHELLMPVDEKLEEFWIDFNLGSHSISFYFTLADAEESYWEAMSVNENEVVSYTVTEKHKRKVLQIKMSEVVVVGVVEGSSLSIHFSSSLDILQAADKIFGPSKNRAPTAEKIAMEENNTQVNTILSTRSCDKSALALTTALTSNSLVEPQIEVIPESQVSLTGSERNTAPYLLQSHSDPLQITTPAKRRISDSMHLITCSGGGIVHSSGPFALKSSSKENSSVKRVSPCEASAKSPSHLVTSCGANTGMELQCDSSIQSTTSETACKTDKHKMSKPCSEAVSMVISGQGEEQNFVPDSQPKMGKTINKWSISEMLMLPMQKINSLPKPEFHSSLGGKQEHPQALKQKLSVSDSFPIWQKKLHIEVTQRLQSLLDADKSDTPPQEPALPQKRKSNIKEKSKNSSSGDQRISSPSATEEPQVQSKESTDEKAKRKSSLELDASVVKSDMTKTVLEKVSSMTNNDNNLSPSSKIKGDKDVTSSMVKLISRHYKKKTQSTEECSASTPQPLNPPLTKRPVFNTSWLSVSKRETYKTVSHRRTTAKSVEQRKDVFSFTTDVPLPIVGGKKTPAESSTSHNGIHNSLLQNTAKKGQLAEKNNRHVKKHLFSDTDTDNAMTELSWVKESNKAKPKLNQYSREAPKKTTAVPLRTSYESSDLLSTSPKAVMGRKKPSKTQPKKTVKPVTAAAAPRRPRAAGDRPKRAAATFTKNYREPDSDDSESNAEMPSPHPKKSLIRQEHRKKEETSIEVPEMTKKRRSLSERPAESFRKQEGNNQTDLKKTSGFQQLKPQNVFQTTSKLNKKKVAAIQDQENIIKASRAPHLTTRCPSPPLIEKMRSAERSAPTLGSICSPVLSPRGSPLPASPDPPCQDTPPLVLLPSKRGSPVSSKGKLSPPSFYRERKSSSKSNSVQSVPSLTSLRGQTRGPDPLRKPTAREKSKAKKPLSSASPSPLSLPTQPLLTSTVNEQDKSPVQSPPQPPFPKGTASYRQYYGTTKGSTPSLSPSSTKSSVLIDGDKDSPTASAEKTPLNKSGSTLASFLVSGPCRKRHFSFGDSQDNEKQVKKKGKMRGQHSPRMKPRKLFKSFTEVSAIEKLRKLGSLSHRSRWEDEGVDGDLDMDEDPELSDTAVNPTNLYQQFSSEIKAKFQNRYRMMEAYHKQSLKTVQQHVSSISKQVIKHRSQRLELVQKVLSDEIRKLEQDDSVLKSMEKDSTVYWKKQTNTFHLYKKQEATRNETLKRALQSTACHSLEHEEGIFTSQMCLMRNDMKSAQDRLLSKMQENEIESMKRGLHSLFFP